MTKNLIRYILSLLERDEREVEGQLEILRKYYIKRKNRMESFLKGRLFEIKKLKDEIRELDQSS